MVNELRIMPLMVLAAKMCPKNVETTFYALVLAIINLGYLVSYWVGGILSIWLGMSSKDEDFTNFWVLILISSGWSVSTLVYLACLPDDNQLGLRGVEGQTESLISNQSADEQQPVNENSILR